jgi:lipoprotein-anchoring transpeptidase ErfK/SrfK
MLVSLSRRDFLKASSAGLFGLLLADLNLEYALATETPRQGRSTFSGVEVVSEPTFRASQVRLLRQDEVIEIRGEVQGDVGRGNPFNSTWYQIDGQGFVYSGAIQPVATIHQKPTIEIPEQGVLAEVTVPYSDTRRSNSVFADHGYRIYYSTTHWITGLSVNRAEKSIWYEVYDRQTHETLFVPTHDLRLIPSDELTPLSPDVPEEEKRILVDLTNQIVTALEGQTPVFIARCASGAKGTETPQGEFRTYHKDPSVHMTNQGDGTENTYHLPGVPWVSFFTGTGVAFHGTYWHNDYGRPSSRGCVNLRSEDAKFIYRWARPDVPIGMPYLSQPGTGTPVEVTYSAQ